MYEEKQIGINTKLLTTLNNKSTNKSSVNFKFHGTNVNKYIDPNERRKQLMLHFSIINVENVCSNFNGARNERNEHNFPKGACALSRKAIAIIPRVDVIIRVPRSYSRVMNKKYAIRIPVFMHFIKVIITDR